MFTSYLNRSGFATGRRRVVEVFLSFQKDATSPAYGISPAEKDAFRRTINEATVIAQADPWLLVWR
jgi:hypothetical protein